jgi:hypothetical protein
VWGSVVLFVDIAGCARTIKVALHLLRNGHDRDHARVAPTRRDSNADHFELPNLEYLRSTK